MYALIRNNNVLEIMELTESKYHIMIRNYDSIIDISNANPMPEVGWVLRGNILQPLSLSERAFLQQNSQRQFGVNLSNQLVDLVGARNLELAFQGSNPNVSSMLTALGSILSLLQTGALKTARTAMLGYKNSFIPYVDIFELGINNITTFLQDHGWD